MVRAKFWVQAVKRHTARNAPQGESGGTVELVPVMDGSEENKTWSKYTPSGKIEMHISNPPAFAQFEEALGNDVYVDFTFVPKPA